MSIELNGTTGITTPGLTNTGTETIVNLTTTGNTILGNASTDTLNVGNGDLVKDASGNVGIGVTPSNKLDVSGTNASGGSGIKVSNLGNGASLTPYAFINFQTGGDDGESSIRSYRIASGIDFQTRLSFFVNPSGNTHTPIEAFNVESNNAGATKATFAGIVTMSAYGAGAATFSASGVISSVSDETWKTKDGVPLNPDAMLQKLEPGYWYYNEEKAPIFGADRQLGFYAQNVNYAIGIEAAPIPEEGKPWGYYDRSVLAVTVMSLQKALATIESLTARLEVIEGK